MADSTNEMVVQLTTQEKRVLRPRREQDYDDNVTCPTCGHTFPQQEASDPYADDSMDEFIATDEGSSASSVSSDDEYTMEVYSDDEEGQPDNVEVQNEDWDWAHDEIEPWTQNESSWVRDIERDALTKLRDSMLAGNSRLKEMAVDLTILINRMKKTM
ncbi:hypothetical protein HDE_04584 [Halotydeus destructor]|nr:hypothetical protein HDE_04584 [Halotydeus destructor]